MKIILVTPLLDHGGAQRYITTLANYWAGLNHRVMIVLLRQGKPFYKIADNVRIFELRYDNSRKFSKIFSALRAGYRLRKIIKKESPDFILSTLSSTNIFTYLSTVFLRTNLFFRESISPYRERSKIERLFRARFYKKVNGIIVMTQQAKDYVAKETNAKNIKVIPNPLTDSSGHPPVKKENIVINVGRLVGVKGHEYLIRACAKIDRPDWKFVILGDGNQKKRLIQLAADLNVADRIIMPGAVRSVEKWLLRSKIFVSTSLSEAWGNAICEAMSLGLPVVSFDCDVSPREIITDWHDGFLVENKNLDQLVLKIEELMDNPALRKKIGEQAKIKTREFSLDKVSDEILSFVTA